MANFTLEQFEELTKDLDQNVDRRKVARALGLTLPVEILPLDEQLNEVALQTACAQGYQAES